MPTLNIDRTYADGDVFFESDLDNIKNAAETLNNTTKYDGDNFQANAISETELASNSINDSGKIATSTLATSKLAANAVTNAKITTATLTVRASGSYVSNDNATSGAVSGATTATTTSSTSTSRGCLLTGNGSSTNGYLYTNTTTVVNPITITATINHKKGATTLTSITTYSSITANAFPSGNIALLFPASAFRHPLGQAPSDTGSITTSFSGGFTGAVNITELR